MTNVDAFVEAGLYDPSAPDHEDRLALVQWLTDQGFTIAEIQEADAARNLNSLAGDRLLSGSRLLSMRDIAGILNEDRNVLGMMPHPERACDPLMGSTAGLAIFESMLGALVK